MSSPDTWDGYAAAWSTGHGGYDLAKASPVVRGWLRGGYVVAVRLSRLGVGPNGVTVAGIVVGAAVPLCVLGGGPFLLLLGAALVGLGALADTADGALALVTGRQSRLGAVFDAVADRLTEAAWLVALWLLGAPGWLVVLAGGVAWLHEYVRAKAALPDVGTVTVSERPTRVLVTVFGLLAAVVDAALAGTVAAAVWTVLGTVGLVQLFMAVHRALR